VTIELKNINDIDDFKKLTLTEFSYSRIDTYEMCPSKYFFSYIKKEPRQFGEAAVLGNIIHSVLEDLVSKDKPLSLDEMKSSYEVKKVDYDPTGLISADLIAAGNQIIEEFYDVNQDKLFDVYDKEMSFNFIIGNYMMIGYIDRVDVVGDEVFIVDYKTGKREVAAKDVANNLQLGIYALAASIAFPGKQITASLHYLRTGRLKSHTYSQEDLEGVKEMLLAKISRIMTDSNFTPTSNERVCSFCDHAKSGACGIGAVRYKKFHKDI
jgi:RecB family exonuclease